MIGTENRNSESIGGTTVVLSDTHFLTKSIGGIRSSMWQRMSLGLKEWAPVRSVGAWVHTLSRRFGHRNQSHMTWFLRYPPLFLTIRDLIGDCKLGDSVRVCVIGCSTGAEMYSLLWTIRETLGDLKILPTGVDLSESVIEKAKTGRYSRQDPELKGLSEESLSELFDITEPKLKIKNSISAGVEWIVGDVRDDGFCEKLGLQDIVLANNFLIHMGEGEAAECLRKIVQLVGPGGLLVCRGVDLDVRERVTQQFQLRPIVMRIEEIHESAVDARHGWPWNYWGLEPLDKRRRDWVRRYAAVFQAPCSSDTSAAADASAESGRMEVPHG